MDVPALNGGERHRVGVLKKRREEEIDAAFTGTHAHMPDHLLNNRQNNTLHSLTHQPWNDTASSHRTTEQGSMGGGEMGQLNRQPVGHTRTHTHRHTRTHGHDIRQATSRKRREAGTGRRWREEAVDDPGFVSFLLEKNGEMMRRRRGGSGGGREVPYPP